MPNLDFITKVFTLPEACREFHEKENTWIITLPVIAQECPHCHAMTSRVHDYHNRTIKGILTNTPHIWIYRRRRYHCLQCNHVFSEVQSLIGRYQRMPADAALSILSEHGTFSTSTDIAARHGVSATTVQRVARIASVSHPPLPKALSIDEFKGDAGAKFQVILNDLEQRTCVDVLPDRSKERLLVDLLRYPQEERESVRLVCMDMSEYFRSLVHSCFPNAKIAVDKFHAVRMANDALDSVRKSVQKDLDGKLRRLFKKSRRLLMKREDDLTVDEHAQVQRMLNFSEKLSAAYGMKEAYFKLWESLDNEKFIQRLKQFQAAVEKQDIPAFSTLLRTTIRWKKEILHGIAVERNNGFTEGCNNTIKVLKRICFGFRNFEHFRRRIILLLNNAARMKRRTGRKLKKRSAASSD